MDHMYKAVRSPLNHYARRPSTFQGVEIDISESCGHTIFQFADRPEGSVADGRHMDILDSISTSTSILSMSGGKVHRCAALRPLH